MNKKNLIGKRFGRLSVISESENKNGRTAWLCKCDCGNYKVICSKVLINGQTKSCGCISREKVKARNTKHGKRHTRLYRIWLCMKNRCSNDKDKYWKSYGGKGVNVCESWKNNFMNFYEWSINNGYSDDLTLDRINVNGMYCPDNCRWSTSKEQQNNKSNNHYITYNGETKTMMQWSEELNIKYSTLRARINTYKWSVEKALSKPVRSLK